MRETNGYQMNKLPYCLQPLIQPPPRYQACPPLVRSNNDPSTVHASSTGMLPSDGSLRVHVELLGGCMMVSHTSSAHGGHHCSRGVTVLVPDKLYLRFKSFPPREVVKASVWIGQVPPCEGTWEDPGTRSGGETRHRTSHSEPAAAPNRQAYDTYLRD